ncbi:hypothetical protein Hanom_Chr04g00361961 [Helianthus anomalus]
MELLKTGRTVRKWEVGNVSSMELAGKRMELVGKRKLEDDTDALENKKMKLPSLGVERKFIGIIEMDDDKFAVTMGSSPMLAMGTYSSPEPQLWRMTLRPTFFMAWTLFLILGV